MTVSTEAASTEIFVGTGLVDTYAYGFLINDKEDLTVKMRDTDNTETTLVLNTDYTITGEGIPTGGNVVLSSNLVLNYKLVAYRDMDYVQEIDLTNQEAIFLEQLEVGLDNITMQVQQLNKKTELGVYKESTDDSEVPTYTEIFDAEASASASAAEAEASAAEAEASAASVSQTWKSHVECKTTANITLSGEQTLDGVLTSASRVLVTEQTDATENGIYLSGASAWVRTEDCDTAAELNACVVPVAGGTLHHDSIWMEESVVATLETDDVTFARKDIGNIVDSSGAITVDTINEHTVDAGVTVEGVEIKDGLVEGVNIKLYSSFPVYKIDQKWQQKGSGVAVDKRTIQSPNCLEVNINGALYQIISQQDYDLNTSGNWDSAETTYATAANRAGKDFYIYACEPASGNTAVLVLSANSTYPGDYTADTSRKIGGFHCLCVNAGTISGHDLTGYLQGDILPLSVWDLLYRSNSGNEGMVWDERIGKWVDIYLQSGTGSSTKSAYGATITDTRTWMDHVKDLYTVNKFLLDDSEFQGIAEGSNEETNISGSADPGTTGGHSDTASARMISNIGCEDCCGVVWQWLKDQCYRGDGTWAYSWKDETGGKGELYTQGAYGDAKLLAGGYWAEAAYCGSRTRNAYHSRWSTGASVGARGCAEPRIVHL